MRSSEEQNYQIKWDDFKAWPDEADGYNAAEGEVRNVDNKLRGTAQLNTR